MSVLPKLGGTLYPYLGPADRGILLFGGSVFGLNTSPGMAALAAAWRAKRRFSRKLVLSRTDTEPEEQELLKALCPVLHNKASKKRSTMHSAFMLPLLPHFAS